MHFVSSTFPSRFHDGCWWWWWSAAKSLPRSTAAEHGEENADADDEIEKKRKNEDGVDDAGKDVLLLLLMMMMLVMMLKRKRGISWMRSRPLVWIDIGRKIRWRHSIETHSVFSLQCQYRCQRSSSCLKQNKQTQVQRSATALSANPTAH